MLTEHFHHTSIGRNMIIYRQHLIHKAAILDLKDISQTIRVRFIGAKEAKVLLIGIAHKDVTHELTQLTRRFMVFCGWLCHFNGIVFNGWEIQIYKELAAIGMRIGSHASFSSWR